MKVTKAKTLSTLLYRFGCFLPRLVADEVQRTTEHLFKVPHPSARFASPPRTMRSEVGQVKFAKQTTELLLGPVGGVEERRGLGPRAQARFVN